MAYYRQLELLLNQHNPCYFLTEIHLTQHTSVLKFKSRKAGESICTVIKLPICGGGGAPRDSAGSGATEEGLTSWGGIKPIKQ